MSAKSRFDFHRCAQCDGGCGQLAECRDFRHAFDELNRYRWASLNEAARLERLARLHKAEAKERKPP